MTARTRLLMLALLTSVCASAQQAAPPQNNAQSDASELKLLSALPPPSPGSQPPSPDPRNFQGTWYVAKANAPRIREGNRVMPPYTEARLKREQYKREMNDKGQPIAGLTGSCRPPSGAALHIGADQFPSEIVQNSTQVVILNEEMRGRWQILLTDRHPAALQPSYFGDSIGHWEGDTLVAETVGFNGRDDNYSTEAKVISRLRKLDGGRQIELKQTVIDPQNYTRPVESTGISSWNPDLQMLEFQCEENMRSTRSGLLHEKEGAAL